MDMRKAVVALSVACLLFATGFFYLLMEFMDEGGGGRAPQPIEPIISAQEARDVALQFLGGGTAIRIVPIVNDDKVVYEVEMRDRADENTFFIYIDARTSAIDRMYRADGRPVTGEDDIGAESSTSGANISLTRAIEIATADLGRREIEATFRRDSGMGTIDGRQVWLLEFRSEEGTIEYGVSTETGAIVKFEAE
jgi:uncharacterized membrane protein YkoI